MALTSQQRALLARVMATPDWKRASPRERKALIEAGLVESGLRNLNYGDRDSVGYLQQRPSQGWQNPTNIEQATRSFLTRARASNTGHGSAGQLAQSVQRSAFPGRYDQRSGVANSILGGSPSAGSSTTSTTTRTIPGVDRSAGRLAALEQYASQSGRPGSAVDLYLGLQNQQDTPSQAVSSPAGPAPAAGSTAGSAAVRQAFERAVSINGAKLPYRWGGGHAGRVNPNNPVPLDCSGAVSAVLGINPRVSGDFAKWGKPGRGRITVYANSEHVLMEIDGHFFGTSHSNPGGGAGWIPRSAIGPGYLKNFTVRHLPGA